MREQEKKNTVCGRHWPLCFTHVLTVLQANPHCCVVSLGGVWGGRGGGDLLLERTCYCTDGAADTCARLQKVGTLRKNLNENRRQSSANELSLPTMVSQSRPKPTQ